MLRRLVAVREARPSRIRDGIQTEAIQTQIETVPVAAREGRRAVQRPSSQFLEFGQQRWGLVFSSVHASRRALINRHRYVLKCDVSKFFHQIDHAILLQKLAGEIRCPGALELCAKIIDSFQTGADPPARLFPGDDWIMARERPRGLPIGNLTSQLWGNFYLDGLDHRITERESHGAYLRYTDDFLIFGDDKARLWELWATVREELAGLRLVLSEPKSRFLTTAEGVPFCGFRFLPGLRPRVLGATKRRFEKRRHRQYAEGQRGPELTMRIFNWYQFSREANSEGLRRAYSGWPMDGAMRRRRKRAR